MSLFSFNEPLDYTNAVWDDGEWVSWAEITHHAELQDQGEVLEQDLAELEEEDDGLEPEETPENETSIHKLDRLGLQIERAREALGRGEDIGHRIGEMGELYAEARFRLKRHRRYAQGSDGKIGNDFVEVKTISPWKSQAKVRVKRSGHWSKLVVVRIDERWMFDARVIDRAKVAKGQGSKHATVRWQED